MDIIGFIIIYQTQSIVCAGEGRRQKTKKKYAHQNYFGLHFFGCYNCFSICLVCVLFFSTVVSVGHHSFVAFYYWRVNEIDEIKQLSIKGTKQCNGIQIKTSKDREKSMENGLRLFVI